VLVNSRKLVLKRESLVGLTDGELDLVDGGTVGRPTAISCLDYISCWAYQCVPTLDARCIQ
jgi:hypothetical protein